MSLAPLVHPSEGQWYLVAGGALVVSLPALLASSSISSEEEEESSTATLAFLAGLVDLTTPFGFADEDVDSALGVAFLSRADLRAGWAEAPAAAVLLAFGAIARLLMTLVYGEKENASLGGGGMWRETWLLWREVAKDSERDFW
jgi:hypothetical protein